MYVDGKMFDWGDGTVKLSDRTLVRFEELTGWGDSVERKLYYGKGNKPRGHTQGNYKAENISIKLSIEEYNEILNDPEVKKNGILNTKFVIGLVLDKGNNEIYEGSVDGCMVVKRSLDNFKQGGDSITEMLEFFSDGELKENGSSPFGDA
jgi:hypothetical protein